MKELNLSKIKAFAFDVDGVFTDGGIFCDLSGELFRTFDSKDGFAVRMAVMKGYPVAIITGGRSASIRARFLSCGVPAENVYLGSRDKIVDMNAFCAHYGLGLDEVLYAGDDIPDIETMAKCGIGMAPADAVPEALEIADWVSTKLGGKGCVREAIETVMKAQGTWVFDTAQYKKNF